MSAEEERKLFVAGLGDAVTEDGLRQLFEGTGAAVAHISMPRDRATGRPRGFAFVTLEAADQAKNAIEELNGEMYEGKPVSVRPFRSERTSQAPLRGERPSRHPAPVRAGTSSEECTLYVGNLPFDATEEEISQWFEEAGFGGVRRVHLPTDPEGRRRGFGFITLADAETAQRAAEELEGSELKGRNLSVNLARRGGGGPGSGAAAGGGPRPARPRAPDDDRVAMPARPARSAPPPPGVFNPEGSVEEGRRLSGRRERKKEKKRKGRGLAPDERGPKRRRNEGFGAPRARGGYDDFDDD